jgi:hypothetical protein
MHPDLERLIRLQQVETENARAQSALGALPGELAALDARLADREQALAAAHAGLDENQLTRRAIEKDLAAAQSRLSKYRDQLMAVKTNKEYQAMQHEITTAEREVRALEDRILDGMESAEAINAEVKAAEAGLEAERVAVDEEKRTLQGQATVLEAQLATAQAGRQALVKQIGAEALALFEHVARRRAGVVVAEARDGHCTECQMRLRPQHFNEIRRNDSLMQCESCLRILYYAGPAGASAPADL